MAKTDLSGRLFQKNLLELVKDIVWKDDYAAMLAEKTCDRIYTDKYTSSARKLLEYYSSSELKVITDCPDVQYERFLNSAPEHLKKYMKIFREYEEPNTYYRMLFGKPPLHCEPKYLVYPKINNKWDLDPNEGIHDAPTNILTIIENEGGLDRYKELVKVDKTFEYVNHMTKRKVYPFTARLASAFDLLYSPPTEIANLGKDFREQYQLCRDFIVYRYYSSAYRYQQEYYEGLIGMAILFQTIQQMHVKYLDADITRDFYDLDSIRVIYDAYSVPFFEMIPTYYHQKIVKLMNKLIMYKGGNQVFFDLCSLFEYEELNVFKYYLVRTQKMDDEGHPKFFYNQSGHLDYQATYDISFAKGTLDGDPFFDIIDENNKLEYYPITNADPYWYNDSDLMNKIYTSEYNFTDTKYIGLQMVFSLTKYLFETGYFIQMIIDNRYKVSFVRVSHGKLGTEIDLFTLIVYIHAIICERLGFKGNIPDTFDKKARVLGFNFKDDIEYIIRDITANAYTTIEDMPKLLEILQDMNITNLESCRRVYEHIKELYILIDHRLLATRDVNTYFAYKHFRQVLLTTEQNAAIYRKSDGTQAKTVMELLEDLDLGLALRIKDMSESQLTQELQYSLAALEKAGNDMKYLQTYGGASGEIISKYLYALIRVFKSAKVDLVDFKTIYTVDGRSTNMIKLMDQLRLKEFSRGIDPSILQLVDNIHHQIIKGKLRDDIPLEDFLLNTEMIHVIDDKSFGIGFKDIIVGGERNWLTCFSDTIPFTDNMEKADIQSTIKDNSLTLKDVLIKVE